MLNLQKRRHYGKKETVHHRGIRTQSLAQYFNKTKAWPGFAAKGMYYKNAYM
jgi:hypothetical protein